LPEINRLSMKKLFCIVIFTMIKSSLFCQITHYRRFPELSAHWNEEFQTFNQTSVTTDWYSLFFSGDTVMGSKKYHKILKSGLVQGISISNKYIGALRQDSLQKKVFFKPVAQAEQLLYDFNLSIGDTLALSFNNHGMFFVSSIDSVLVGTNFRKRFLLNNLTANAALIEGIGSTFGLFNEIQEVFFEPTTASRLICFKGDRDNYPQNLTCKALDLGEKERLSTLDLIKIVPNPVLSEIKIVSERVLISATITILSLDGQKIIEFCSLSGNSIQLQVGSLATGVYVLQNKDNNRFISHKLIVKSVD